uniref:Uncharacterized protein n=1 Tax=Molossus molossus TaxID=27622 RepID=A0A7J8JW61_MOLMO|nr:hypothetical protein HJG59_008068 [Molossus molossus]
MESTGRLSVGCPVVCVWRVISKHAYKPVKCYLQLGPRGMLFFCCLKLSSPGFPPVFHLTYSSQLKFPVPQVWGERDSGKLGRLPMWSFGVTQPSQTIWGLTASRNVGCQSLAHLRSPSLRTELCLAGSIAGW